MSTELDQAADRSATAQRCEVVVARLAALYAWQLEPAEAAALAQKLVETAAAAQSADERLLEQTCCRLRFAALFRALEAADGAAERALAELFSVAWFDAPDGGQEVRYGGYLYRAALATLRRQLARHGASLDELSQHAADAAVRALTRLQARFRDCRDPDAFWGWTARVAENAALDELRSGRATGGRSLRAGSLDAAVEAGATPADESGSGERRIDVLAVRQELLRKCRLGKLSRDQREALVRSFWNDERPREIAAALSAERGEPVTAAQVSLWKHRGLQIMEANLREQGFT